MAANNRVGGRLFVKVNGEVMRCFGTWKITWGSPQRETVKGPDAIHGFSEQPGEPSIEGAFVDDPSLDVQAILEGTGLQVTAELANGVTASMRDAWQAGSGEYDSSNGTYTVKFCGTSIQRLAA